VTSKSRRASAKANKLEPRHFPRESSKATSLPLDDTIFPITSNYLQNGRRKTQLNPQTPNTRFLCTFSNVRTCPPDVVNTHANLLINSTSKNADDVVITLAIRTPLAKGFKGGFKDTQLDYLVYSLLKKVIEKSKLDPQLVEDICCGNVRLFFPGSQHWCVRFLNIY
jgi:hypothetical protein